MGKVPRFARSAVSRANHGSRAAARIASELNRAIMTPRRRRANEIKSQHETERPPKERLSTKSKIGGRTSAFKNMKEYETASRKRGRPRKSPCHIQKVDDPYELLLSANENLMVENCKLRKTIRKLNAAREGNAGLQHSACRSAEAKEQTLDLSIPRNMIMVVVPLREGRAPAIVQRKMPQRKIL